MKKALCTVLAVLCIITSQVQIFALGIGEQCIHGPAFAVNLGSWYYNCLAWTGTDKRINFEEVAVTAKTFSPQFKRTLNETSNFKPAIVKNPVWFYIAWTGTNGQINILATDNHTEYKYTLSETSIAEPSLSLNNNTLILAWTGLDKRLNVKTFAVKDGSVVENRDSKATLDEKSSYGPAIANIYGFLCIAWTGTDKKVNYKVAGSYDFKDTPMFKVKKVTLDQYSLNSPSLTAMSSYVYLYPFFILGFAGTDNKLNVAEIDQRSGYVVTYTHKYSQRFSNYAPSCYDGIVFWADLNGNINFREYID